MMCQGSILSFCMSTLFDEGKTRLIIFLLNPVGIADYMHLNLQKNVNRST